MMLSMVGHSPAVALHCEQVHAAIRLHEHRTPTACTAGGHVQATPPDPLKQKPCMVKDAVLMQQCCAVRFLRPEELLGQRGKADAWQRRGIMQRMHQAGCVGWTGVGKWVCMEPSVLA